MLKVCKAKMHGVVRACAVGEVSKTAKSDNKRITASNARSVELRKTLILRWLPRMDSNHDKVIQSFFCKFSAVLHGDSDSCILSRISNLYLSWLRSIFR
jgi:hypothetical protein